MKAYINELETMYCKFVFAEILKPKGFTQSDFELYFIYCDWLQEVGSAVGTYLLGKKDFRSEWFAKVLRASLFHLLDFLCDDL